MPKPFSNAIADAEIADLKARLAATRFPQTLAGVGWNYGIEDGFLRRFVDYWANQYDWRAAEARLNGFAQFIEEIEGEAVHFVHAKGRGETNVPLLLTNGWPSNFVELLPLVPLLTEPVDGVAFDVVIPSLPGYGFSGQPTRPGMNLSAVAPLWAGLAGACPCVVVCPGCPACPVWASEAPWSATRTAPERATAVRMMRMGPPDGAGGVRARGAWEPRKPTLCDTRSTSGDWLRTGPYCGLSRAAPRISDSRPFSPIFTTRDPEATEAICRLTDPIPRERDRRPRAA